MGERAIVESGGVDGGPVLVRGDHRAVPDRRARRTAVVRPGHDDGRHDHRRATATRRSRASPAAYRDGASDEEALEAGTGVPADELYADFFADVRRRRARRRSSPRRSRVERRPAGAATGRPGRRRPHAEPPPRRAPGDDGRRPPGPRAWSSSAVVGLGDPRRRGGAAAAVAVVAGGAGRVVSAPRAGAAPGASPPLGDSASPWPGRDRLRRRRAVEQLARARGVHHLGAAGAGHRGRAARSGAGDAARAEIEDAEARVQPSRRPTSARRRRSSS